MRPDHNKRSDIANAQGNGNKGACNAPLHRQRNYYERIIRAEQELESLRQYITVNPAQWEKDENYHSL